MSTPAPAQPYRATLRELDRHRAKLLAAIKATREAYATSLPNMSDEEFRIEWARRYSIPDLAGAICAEARRRGGIS
jgi:hypothetical protein